MSDALNPVTFSDLPTTNSLLSSDKIIVFKEIDGSLSPSVYSMSDLSSVIVLAQDISDIQNKVEAIKSQISNAMLYLQKTFISNTDAAATYGTITQLNAIVSTLEKKVSFSNKLENKATAEYLDHLYNKALAICKEAKVRLGDCSVENRTNWESDDEKGEGYKVILAKKAKTKEE